jgi:hypothetical protein
MNEWERFLINVWKFERDKIDSRMVPVQISFSISVCSRGAIEGKRFPQISQTCESFFIPASYTLTTKRW